MKPPARSLWGLMGLAALALGLLIVLVFSSSVRSGAISQITQCAPTPFYPIELGTGTPTPDPFGSITDLPDSLPSATPLVTFANLFDLAPEAPDDEKYSVIVWRCNGTFDAYLAVTGEPSEVVQLGPGDVIWDVIPSLNLVGNQVQFTQTPPGLPLPVDTPLPTEPEPAVSPELPSLPTGYPVPTEAPSTESP